jgi:phospholipid/cholesterol/gamma-HCH transport system ATP-binding protein
MAAIELEGVIKEIDSERVLDRVDLAAPTGAITVLLGPSGAGKTVTVKHVVGLMQPSAGRVMVDGRDLASLDEEALNEVRRTMGVVLQGSLPFSCGLFYSLNVFENVAFPLRERTRWPEDRIRRVTIEHLEMMGLGDHISLMPDQLSAGMTKRVALARAFALQARIVIIDDFDSGIDGVRLALLCELIAELHERTGATFLITTHDMAAARRLGEHAAVIHQGRIVAAGLADEVLASDDPLVSQLVSGRESGPIRLGAG